MHEYTIPERENLFKIFPWSIDVKDQRVMNLLRFFENEGYDVEINCIEDRDNGDIPVFWVYDTKFKTVYGDALTEKKR